MNPILQFENLYGGYGDTTVLRGISGSIHSGQVLGVFGRNGVGKTTLARMLVGAILSQSGQILIDGENVEKTPTFERRRRGIGHLPQTEGVFRDLTVRENFDLIDNSFDPEPFFVQFPRLKERLLQKAGTMSGGEQKIAGFTRALLEDTKLVILDEPSEGVQQENIIKMAKIITSAKACGRSFLVIEQNLEFLLKISDNLLGLDGGEQVLSGAADDFSKSELIHILSV
jgi:ABC-type branched-subunit amino acid transport system ATPase component